MITLDRNSWFVKYWIRTGCTESGFKKITKQWPHHNDISSGTNLCQLVRINIYAFLKLAFVVAFLWVCVIHPILIDPLMALVTLAGVVGLLGFSVGFVWLISRIVKYFSSNDSLKQSLAQSLPIQYYKAWKGKYCPIIEFTEQQENI